MSSYRMFPSLHPSLMAMHPLLPLLFSLLSAATISATPIHQSIIATSAPLYPNQLKALQAMKAPISNPDPCSDPAIICDSSFPFRNAISLKFHNCPKSLSISAPQLNSLSQITALEIINCPFNPNSNPTPLSLILDNLKKLETLTISNSNLTESFPDKWENLTITHLDLSNNQLQGKVPISFGDLVCLKTLSLANNSLEGNVLNFILYMKGLRYLNLENNKFDDFECLNHDSLTSTKAVKWMALVLSVWIVFIALVMLLANCGRY